MSKLRALIRRAPKRFSAVIAMLAAAIIIPAAVFAWGPSRPTFTMANPATYVTFNSITDNPVHGDERNFVRVREASAGNETYTDDMTLKANTEYVIMMYYHNNAATRLNDAAHNYAGVAKGAYVKAQIPTSIPAGNVETDAIGYVGATNATPSQVWDEVTFKNNTSTVMGMNYVPGSATIHNFGSTNGQKLSDSLVTTGAAIGYNSLNGEIPGCNEFSGFVTFRVKTNASDFSIQKQVRLAGETEYKENVTAQPGDTLEYRIEYKNTGAIQQNDVVLKDTLPANVSYVPGSTTLKNAANPNGKTVSDNLTTATGINIGNYTAGSNAYVKFQAKVAAVEALPCGTTTLVNKATVQVGTDTKSDNANATVNKECEEVKTIKVCEIASKTIVTIDEKDFDDSKYTKDLTQCEELPTPPELPHTGATETILGVLGIGSIVASLGYYLASRRALGNQ